MSLLGQLQGRVARLTRSAPGALDWALALGTLAVAAAMMRSGRFDHGIDARALDWPGGLLAGAASIPLAFRRRGPLAVFVLITAATAALYGLRYSLGPPLGSAIALFHVANIGGGTRVRRSRAVAVVLAMLTIVVAGHIALREGSPAPELFLGLLVWGGAWILGDQTRQRRQRMAALEERAARAVRESERERRLAAAEERMRIARDLHDSAGHAINVILVQAGAARLLMDRDPQGSRAALEVIEEVARETIGEIDRLVRVLREDAGGGVEPQPGLAALDALVERHRGAGLGVTVGARGEARPLAPAVDQAAYRILQEALTNAARHGGGSAHVDVAYDDGVVALTVTNPVPEGAPAAPAGGHGIVGMRERALLLGGALEAGRQDGVWRVRASLPAGGRG